MVSLKGFGNAKMLLFSLDHGKDHFWYLGGNVDVIFGALNPHKQITVCESDFQEDCPKLQLFSDNKS